MLTRKARLAFSSLALGLCSIIPAAGVENPVVPGATLGAFRHGTFPALGATTHVGVDLVADCGTYVWAFADGRIVDRIASSSDPNFSALGYMALLEHPPLLTGKTFYTLYLHLEEPPPEVGTEVNGRRSFIGKVGNTGRSTGCHTHFEIRYFWGRFSGWNNIYGQGDQRGTDYFTRNWEDPEAWFAKFPGGLHWASGKLGSMLLAASEAGRVDAVREVLAKGADPNAADADGQTALILACRGSSLEVAKLLLGKGSKVNLASAPIGDGLVEGDTPLLAAIESGNAKLVKLLLDAGANPNGHGTYNATVIVDALGSGNREMVDLMLAAGADLRNDGDTLVAAAGGGHTAIVKMVLQGGVNVNAGAGYKGSFTALMASARNGHISIVKLLLDSRAEADLNEGASGLTALGMAAEEGHVDIVRMLLKAGANVEGGEAHGQSALAAAAERGHTEVVKELLAVGANTQKVYDGQTPLARATQAGHAEIVRLLRDAGAKH